MELGDAVNTDVLTKLDSAVIHTFADKVQFTRVGLVFTGDLRFDEWQILGQSLKDFEHAVHWWIGDWLNYGERKWGEMYTQATEETGYKEKTLRNDKWVAGRFELSCRQDNLSFQHHAEVAGLPQETALELLERAENEGMSTGELRVEAQRAKRAISFSNSAVPDGKYRVIYADPPWQYGDKLIKGYGAAEHHYPTMSIEDLCALPIKDLAEDNAVLFLWTTSPLLEESFAVIRAWGFQYKTSFVWDKVGHNPGHYNSVRHEFLLVCTRGSCTPDARELFDSVQSIPKDEQHSRKPEVFRKIIDTLYAGGKRIELFARGEYDGWDCWGNEAHG